MKKQVKKAPFVLFLSDFFTSLFNESHYSKQSNKNDFIVEEFLYFSLYILVRALILYGL